jgi:hypothetical protein
MDDSTYLFCKIFVEGTDVDTVKSVLCTLLGGQFERHSLYLEGLVVDVRRNTDAVGAAGQGNDFVQWPVLVELDAEAQDGGRAIVETTAKVLRALWDTGHPAIAACDFEDQLPWSGGIQRLCE